MTSGSAEQKKNTFNKTVFQNSSSASSCRKDSAKKKKFIVQKQSIPMETGGTTVSLSQQKRLCGDIALYFLLGLKTKMEGYIEVNEILFYTYMKNWFLNR